MSYYEASEFLKTKTNISPNTAVVLGSGLSELIDMAEVDTIIPYSEIPGFPELNNTYHKCRSVFGKLSGKDILIMQGRIHYYEGFSMQELVFPIRMMKYLGIETVILTNASGAINTDFVPGDLVMIEDHIKLGFDSPLRGKNPDEFGERFFDMSNAYTSGLKELALSAAEKENINLKTGVYGYMTGPQFETPAEIRMLRIAGADIVGMSTVPEVIAACHCGIKVLGLSGVSNMAAGIENGGFNTEVIENAEPVFSDKVKRLIERIICDIN